MSETAAPAADGAELNELEQLRVRTAQLEQALASRVVIEQAKGVLAERYRLDVEEAFELIRRSARSNRMRVHDLSADVVASPRTPDAIERELVRGHAHRNGARPRS